MSTIVRHESPPRHVVGAAQYFDRDDAVFRRAPGQLRLG